ncbi:MAG TPA: YoaK family protein [Jatrophihabitans sp.]|jgi:uncharacterized membrane protein YoaK (UPF0700 family)|nr:YoaK family protein [Jatrophihabitans sp.]
MSPTGTYLRDPDHGPLPALLLALTVATGVVDAVSIIGLGRVFVANMTGNVAFVGFALAGTPGFSLAASLIALAGFLAGAGVGGWAVGRYGAHRGQLLRNAAGIEFVLLGLAAGVAALAGSPLDAGARDAAVALAAIALGVQNAVVRKLAVPDLTTTVLTMTLTGIASELRGGNLTVALRRALSVSAMLVGALGGALLVLHVNVGTGLVAAAGIVLVVLIGATVASRAPAEWQHPKK